MIQSTPIHRAGEYAAFLADSQAGMVAAASAAGNNPAGLWVEDNGLALLWDRGNDTLYIAGGQPEAIDLPGWQALVKEQIAPQAMAEGQPYFKVRDLAGLGPEMLEALFGKLVPLHKLFYRLSPKEAAPAGLPDLPGLQIERVDVSFLSKTRRKNLDFICGEIEKMWPSLERFCQNGFGFAGVLDDVIAGWCTAEFMSVARCGIGVEVLEDYQEKGLATALTTRLVALCLERGIQPHWECDAQNPASIRVAEKSGFVLWHAAIFWGGKFCQPPKG